MDLGILDSEEKITGSEGDSVLSYLRGFLSLPNLRYEDITFFTVGTGEDTMVCRVEVFTEKKYTGLVGRKFSESTSMTGEQLTQHLYTNGSKFGNQILRRRIK